jgi:uncharacterized protein
MRIHSVLPPEWDCKVRISLIRGSGEPYAETFDLPLDGAVEHWGQLYKSLGSVRASFEANFAGERIIVRVAVSADFSLPCSRCLEETGLVITGDMRYLFTLRPFREDARKPRGGGDSPPAPDGDVDVIELDGFQPEFDIAPYIWEALILHLPERILCREDCKGLCPVCGSDRNERDCGCAPGGADPRLEVLRGLK